MKKLKGALYVLLCLVVFIGFYLVGARLGMSKFSHDKFSSMTVKWNDSVGTVVKDISYGEKESNKYDLYLPAAEKDAYSLILHIHGGGFSAGDKREGEIICKYYVSKGYVTASVNYSLMNNTQTGNLNIMCDELLIAVNDILSVAEEKGYHITEMATTGESAGGTLALLLPLRYGDRTPVPVKFVIEESGPASFIPELWAPGSSEQERVDFINNMTGLNLELTDYGSEAYENAIDSISPASYINQDTIPLLLAYGAGDVVVPPNIKEPMLEALEQNSASYDYILFPNSGHSLYNDPEQMEEYRTKMNEYVEKYFTN